MKKIVFLIAAAAAFGVAPLASSFGALGGAGVLLALGIAMAVAASGSFVALAAAGGALGAFAGGVLAPTSPAVAGAALAGLCFAERTLRVRSQSARLLHLGVAVVGGALAGSLSTSFGAASIGVRGVAMAVAAVLVALPLLVDADDPVAHALDGAASDVSEPARGSLRRGAELRRTIDEELMSKRTARQMSRTWKALLRLSEVRGRLERTRALRKGTPAELTAHADAVIRKVDDRLEEHVKALARAYSAVDTSAAAEASLDDTALRGVEQVGESLENVSRAIVDEV